ncbi:CG42566 [Drosophila busckii]|uniref:CG42566 n=1 Tax=Drosophila busckii TaxID=30019 RepID=A0A0M4EEI3_DROBS|nr:lipopolysaccharide-induced tumor necrosis factor-alpha factor [Drosophila busckii]ALC42502.1 CG42566 [Drosophila busckii]
MSNTGYTPAQTYQPGGAPPVIIQTTTTTNLVSVGSEPSRVQCPSCHAQIVTDVKRKATGRTHCWALVLCLFLCWPCAIAPYCMASCQNTEHTCPNCGAYIGTYES